MYDKNKYYVKFLNRNNNIHIIRYELIKLFHDLVEILFYWGILCISIYTIMYFLVLIGRFMI